MRRLSLLLLVAIVFAMPASAGVQVPSGITEEATGPAGAVVSYSAVGSGDGPEGEIDENGRPKLSCSPSSGSTFPLGTTTVTCTQMENGTAKNYSFAVTVVDTRPPVLDLRGTTIQASSHSGGVASYAASAFDLVDGQRPVSCTPPSGSHFPVGRNIVNCSASDTRGNSAAGTLEVEVLPVATPPPTLNLPDDMTVEATGPSGAVVTYDATANVGDVDDENGRPRTAANCTPPSGSTFPLGTTTVQCTVTDAGGSANGSFNVTVVDTTAPALRVPRDFTVEGTSNDGAVVTYDATAADIVDGPVAVNCSPASGSNFPVGSTAVICTASDAAGNSASDGFSVTVTAPDAPPPPPTLNLPDDITVEADGPNGTIVTFTATTSNGGSNGGDDENGRPTGGGGSVTCTPASGSLFPLGTTTVQCTAGDLSGSFLVTVVDTTAPALTLPGDITSTNPVVDFTATATDLVDGNVAVTCTPPSGSTFDVGTTSVNCSASDAAGNSASGSFTVTIEDDSQPPDREIIVTASPNKIWPPDKKFVTVTITVAMSDQSSFTAAISSVTSSENDPDDKTSPDWVVTGPLTVDVRAEKSEQAALRVYTITVDVTDDTNTTHQKTVTVSVENDDAEASQPSLEKSKSRGTSPTRRRSQPPTGGS